MVQPLWRTEWKFLRKPEIELPCDPAVPHISVYPEENIIQEDTLTPMFVAALLKIAKTQEYPKCPLTDEEMRKMWYMCIMEY